MISETLISHNKSPAENLLDFIIFNTSTLASQHNKELRDSQNANINYLNIEIKTTEAQLASTLFQNPPTKAQTNYLNLTSEQTRGSKWPT